MERRVLSRQTGVSRFIRPVVKKLIYGGLRRKLQNVDHFSETLNDMKASINEAHALLFNEEMIFLADKVSSQDQVDMLTTACYDAEDIVSKIEFKIMNCLEASKMLSLMNDAIVRRVSLHRAGRLSNRFLPVLLGLEETISQLQKCLELIIKVQTLYSMSSQNSCPSHLCTECTHVSSLVGRDEEVMAIIQELTSQEKLKSVGVSIVGMNGVGKSALAHQILFHDKVRQLYPRRLWISLSGKFDLEEIVKQLVEINKTINPDYIAIKESNCYDSLRSLLAVIIQDVPWLIVFDNLLDVSSTADWNHFQSSFVPSSRGKIIITTVNHDISSVTQTTRYCLHPLSDKHCQEVLLKTGMDDSLVLWAMNDIVAKNCCGLPIIANFIGAQLSIEDKCGIVQGKDLWEFPEFQRQILPTLSATYSRLETHQLRRCFSYFSLFPHDYLYNMEELIHLWIGEGFIQCQEDSSLEDFEESSCEDVKESSMEDIASDYFQTLVRWSILQPLGVDGDDGLTYKIHECTHKLAQLVASDTCFRLDEQGSYSGILVKNTRHLSLTCQSLKPEILDQIAMLKGRLRTFLPLAPLRFPSSLTHFVRTLSYIRVLSFKHSDVVQIPQSIGKLKFLRYLDISDTRISKLPETVTTLYNLQFLKLRNTKYLIHLPKKFKNLINLRHIDWELQDMKRLISLPSSIGKLTSLQRLPLFAVHERKGYRIEELCNMVHLQGSICITNLENVNNCTEAASANLDRKTSLKSLEFQWSSKLNTDFEREIIAEEVLTMLKPHKNLRILRIKNYVGRSFPRWLSCLHELETLYLRGCKFCIDLPALGPLASLKVLHIENMKRVKSLEGLFLESSFHNFPRLESLTLRRLPNLLLWKVKATDLPHLRELTIVDCPELISLPSLDHLKSLINLRIINCAKLTLSPEKLSPSLMSVDINKCDFLMDQFQVGAQDWYMKTHIPNLWISGKFIPTSRESSFQVVEESSSKVRMKPDRWLTLSLALNAIVRMRTLAAKYYDAEPELRKPSGRWDTPSLLVLKAIARMRVTIMEKYRYTTELINKLIPNYEEKACTKQLTQLSHPLQMMHHCLLFPEDYEFEKERLVRLWVAAGFLENEPQEDYGNRFFKFLLELSFIVTSRNDTLGGTKLYKFNSVKCSSYFEQFGPINHFNKKLDSASIVINRFYKNSDISVTSSGIDQNTFGLLGKFSHLRTILFLNGSLLTKVPSTIFLGLKFLRALDFSCSGIKELPDSVQNAKQLRYLDLSWTVIERLPDSITDLGELQDLILKGCEHLFQLPKAVNKLTNLRHLDFDVLGQLTSMPEGIGKLVELRTLWAFIVGTLDYEGNCNIKQLRYMNHLSGKLCISGLENVMKLEDAQSAGLANKPCLLHLELRWSNIYEENERCNYDEVLEGLEANTCLEHLQLMCFPGSKFPKWIGDSSYINLVSIMLYRCDNCECLPSLGELPILKELEILEMNGVKIIDEGFFGDVMHDQKPFPKLEMLTIDGMHSLEKWDGLNGDNFGSVVNLTIKHCPKLSELVSTQPCFQNLQHLELVRCPALQSLPDGLLSTSLQTLIIEYCPFGDRYQEGGADMNKIQYVPEVLIFPDVQSSDEDATEEDVSVSGDLCNGNLETENYVPNGN